MLFRLHIDTGMTIGQLLLNLRCIEEQVHTYILSLKYRAMSDMANHNHYSRKGHSFLIWRLIY